MNSEDMVLEHIDAVAEGIEEIEDLWTDEGLHDAVDPLEVKATVSLDGYIQDITLVLSTGGPHVEFDVSGGWLTCSWGNASTTRRILNEAVYEELDDYYHQQFEELVVK